MQYKVKDRVQFSHLNQYLKYIYLALMVMQDTKLFSRKIIHKKFAF